MAQAATPWHLTPAALAVIADIEHRPETELVRDILAPSGSSRMCFVGPEIDALYAVLLSSEEARLGDCAARGVPLPEDILAALFGPADPLAVTPDERARFAAIDAEVRTALAPLQAAA